MKEIEKSGRTYFQRMITVLLTDRNGKLKLKETATELEIKIQDLLDEDVEIKIKRSHK